MKTVDFSNIVSFNRLIKLFTKKSENRYVLQDSIGSGFVQFCQLEKGLHAGIWDCSFREGIEICNEAGPGHKNAYYTLAFFLNSKGLQFVKEKIPLKQSNVWNCFFFSALSGFSILVDPLVRACCVSISVSKNWLANNVAQGNAEFKALKDKLFTTESFLFFDSMNASEKISVQELFNVSWKKSLGSFYIKSSILKIITEFFYKVKERKAFGLPGCHQDKITMIENYLIDRLMEPLPNLKDLSSRFDISISSLRRHFKERYGMNISTYFTSKKIQYAHDLIENGNLTPAKAAIALGYKNVHHFNRIYKMLMEASKSVPLT